MALFVVLSAVSDLHSTFQHSLDPAVELYSKRLDIARPIQDAIIVIVHGDIGALYSLSS